MSQLFTRFPRQSMTLLVFRPTGTRQGLHNAYRHKRSVTATLTTVPYSTATTIQSAKKHTIPRWPRRVLYMVLFGALGFYAGQKPRQMMSSPLIPGTPEDEIIVAYLRKKLESLPLVQELKANPDYSEYEAYSGFSEEDRAHRLTTGPLRGSRGLPVQRVFWNEKEKKAISVVYIGQGLDGWLTIAHGGLLSTLLDESLGRVAMRSLPAPTGVTANLNVNFRKPATDSNFYTVHANLDHDLTTNSKAHVTGQICDLEGKVYTEASALFVVPKKVALRKVSNSF